MVIFKRKVFKSWNFLIGGILVNGNVLRKLVSLTLGMLLLLCCGCQDQQWQDNMHRPTYSDPIPSTQPTENTENEWTVILRYDEKPIGELLYMRDVFQDADIRVCWYGENSYHTAQMDENGVAKIYGLDGNYQVALSGLPDGYTYFTNDYFVSNHNKTAIIDLHRPLRIDQGDGSKRYYPFVLEMEMEGVYRIQINSPDEVLYCRFQPDKVGRYIIKSLACMVEDNIDADMEVYDPVQRWIKDGEGYPNAYTQNFVYAGPLDEEGVVFGLKVSSKDGVYPIIVEIGIMKYGAVE